MATLNADPVWVAKQAAREAERQKLEDEYARAEQPLVDDLRAVGYEVSSAWDLANTSIPYPNALPVLLKHLEQPYPDAVRDGIARALAVRDAKFGWDVLVRVFRDEQGRRTKAGLAQAIAATADDEVIDEVIELASDKRHGANRLGLLEALGRSSTPQAQEALRALGDDPGLATEVQAVLRRHRRRKR